MTGEFAEFVVGGRCGCCGSTQLWWTPARIVEAARSWDAIHGAGPKSREWRVASVDHPASETVRDVFGSFANLYKAAGVEAPARSNNTTHGWTRDLVVAAIFRWVFVHGRVPLSRDWTVATAETPAIVTVRRLFGTWNQALRAAGYEPNERGRRRLDHAAGEGSLWRYTQGCRCGECRAAKAVTREWVAA